MNPSKTFPIEQSYINLAIVNAREQHKKEKQLHEAQHSNDILHSYEEIYGTKTAIDVKNIFETCKTEEQQVLVFGRAGIGKSTFSRYIAYQWAMGSFWQQYELLALIPLRRLTANRYPHYKEHSLIDLVKKEVLQCELTEREEILLKKHFDARKTLWILDGYDEIVQNIPPHLECLFEQLLHTPHHIITSRPFFNSLSYDVQMEITGFMDENILRYVEQFFDQMRNDLADAPIKSQTLMNFLESNSRIWGLAHIPINLELICSLWSNEDWSNTQNPSMTRLYSEMIAWLCRRHLAAKNISIRKISKKEVLQRCQKELAFLENLAFNAMESNTIIIPPHLLEKAMDEVQVSFYDDPNILNFGVLKSYDKQGTGDRTETEKDHYFIHLSFQEYFAARYLMNALRGSQNERVIIFIKHQKYNQRYASVFTFVAGLLSEIDATTEHEIFWKILLRKPLDLVGIRHIQLVISCIEETSARLTIPECTKLLTWIGDVIKHQIIMKNGAIIELLIPSLQRAHSLFYEQEITNAFISLLQCNDIEPKHRALTFISQIKILNPSTAFLATLTATLDDIDERVRRKAREVLEEMGEKAATNEVISQLVRALRDKSEDVRRNACSVLGKMGEKAATNEVINQLVSALGDQSESVRGSACDALGKMGEKAATDEVISRLVSALGDQSEYVRGSAFSALGKMGEKAVTNEVISRLASALRDQSEHVRWNACSALEKMGEKAATNEVINQLVSAVGDQSEYVRGSACLALGKMGENAATKEVISRLMSALGDQSEYVRRNACSALLKMREKAATNEVISQLVRALGDPSEPLRWNVCSALEKMGEKAATNEVISQLARALGDDSERVRWSACSAVGGMGEKAATNEVISRLVSALGDQSECVRESACSALGKMSEKAATHEVISQLVSALGDQSESVRGSACSALEKIGEKAATNEVISQLVSALGDQSEHVRGSACSALGKMREKSATNEVISQLAKALGDQSKYVRKKACSALEKIGEKAATNDVISQLADIMETESFGSYFAAKAVENILSSTAVISQLDPNIIAGFSLSKYASDCFRNISEDELMKFCFDTKNRDWLSAVAKIVLYNGAAVTAIGDKVFIYGNKEPKELSAPTREFSQKLVETLTDQRKRLYLQFDTAQ